jgi:hypothetical protein
MRVSYRGNEGFEMCTLREAQLWTVQEIEDAMELQVMAGVLPKIKRVTVSSGSE